jgi:fructose-specific component phosphotransferase system IIB-like protein
MRYLIVAIEEAKARKAKLPIVGTVDTDGEVTLTNPIEGKANTGGKKMLTASINVVADGETFGSKAALYVRTGGSKSERKVIKTVSLG